MRAKFGEIREFRRTNCELSFQTKIRRNFGASIVLVPAKFRKLGDKPKRKFAAWTEMLVAKFRESFTKFRVINEISFRVKRNFVIEKFVADQDAVV